MRAYADHGMETVRLDRAGAVAAIDDLARLASEVQAHHGNPAGVEASRRTLRYVLDDYPGPVWGLAAVREGALVAFHLLYEHSGGLYSALWGQVYDDRTFASYARFVILTYETLRLAFARGCRFVEYGIGLPEEHVQRGATPVPLYGYFSFPGVDAGLVAERVGALDASERALSDAAFAQSAYRTPPPARRRR